MELFIWVWAYDKRLLCGLDYGKQGIVYIWLIPAFCAAAVLGFSFLGQLFAEQSFVEQCISMDKDLKHEAKKLSRVMLIQEGILLSVLFASLLTMIVAKRIFKSHSASIEAQQKQTIVVKKAGQVVNQKITVKNAAYDFHVRNETIRSLPCEVLKVLAIINYAFSFGYRSVYNGYVERAIIVQQSTNACIVPGSESLAVYSIYLVFGFGTLVISIYALALLQKVVHLLSVLICPITMVNCKKRWHNVPTDFQSYVGEFDFGCGDENYEDNELGSEASPNKRNVVTHADKFGSKNPLLLQISSKI